MKVRICLLPLVCVLVAAATAGAQLPPNAFIISPEIGAGLPTNGFQAADTPEEAGAAATFGFGGGVMVERMVTPQFAVGVGGQFGVFDGDVTQPSSFDSRSYKILIIDLAGRFFPLPENGKVQPYVTAGAMFGKVEGTLKDGTEQKVKIDWSPGMMLGGGVLYLVNPTLGVFGAVEFRHIETKDVNATLEEDGTETGEGEWPLRTQWVGIRAGVSFFVGAKQ